MNGHTGPVRAGEELDLDSLAAWIEDALPEHAGSPLAVHQFSAGFSNLTYLVSLRDEELVLRRPPFGSKVATAHDMSREYRVLTALHPLYDKAPRPVAFCEDSSVLGAPFYLMERCRGQILRRDLPRGQNLSVAEARRLSESFVQALAELHRLDAGAPGLRDLGHPKGYVERQVKGWSKRWRVAATSPRPGVDRVAAWLDEHRPRTESGIGLVHNDFKFDNLVVDPADVTRVRAVLDWEMCTVGDPLLDLGTSLGYWVEAGDPEPLLAFRFGPTHLPGSFTRRELAERWSELTGRSIEHLTFAWVFGLFKILVIVEQIYARYEKGLTRDPRFAPLPQVVSALAAVATSAISPT